MQSAADVFGPFQGFAAITAAMATVRLPLNDKALNILARLATAVSVVQVTLSATSVAQLTDSLWPPCRLQGGVAS